MTPRARMLAAAVAAALTVAACGDDGADTDERGDDLSGTTVTLVTYDSFPTPDPENPLHAALAAFTDETGIEVEVLIAGDTGTMLAKAELTAGNPEGDVMYGIDNTFLSRAIDAEIFEPYASPAAVDIPDRFTDLVPNDEATPVDFGDVCLNYDVAALEAAALQPPESLADLTDPIYADRLVVQNPATSSPGLAFLLATIAEFGDGWEQYWADLAANGVEIVDSWTTAYYDSFSWSGGDRPLVVSYGSSPPLEVLYADEPIDAPSTGVVTDTCFRQVEFAGVLAGTEQPEAARRLIDFLVSEQFQVEVPLNLFVFPVNPAAELDPVFVEYATIPESPLSLDPSEIAANREAWIERWTEIVAG